MIPDSNEAGNEVAVAHRNHDTMQQSNILIDFEALRLSENEMTEMKTHVESYFNSTQSADENPSGGDDKMTDEVTAPQHPQDSLESVKSNEGDGIVRKIHLKAADLINKLRATLPHVRILKIRNNSMRACYISLMIFVDPSNDAEDNNRVKKKTSKILLEANGYIVFPTTKECCHVDGYALEGEQFWFEREIQLFTTKLTTLTVLPRHQQSVRHGHDQLVLEPLDKKRSSNDSVASAHDAGGDMFKKVALCEANA